MTHTQYAVHHDTPWTVDDIATLERMTAEGASARQIGLALGRTAAAVRTRRQVHRAHARPVAQTRSRSHAEYTRQELRDVRKWIDERVPVREQARRLQRTRAAVQQLHLRLRSEGKAGYMYPLTCTIDGCDNRHHASWLCNRHYKQMRGGTLQ